LGQIGDARAVPALLEALHDPKEHVRVAAAGALGQIGDARAVDGLLAALRDPDAHVRAAAALGQIARRTRQAIPPEFHQAAIEAGWQWWWQKRIEPLAAWGRS
jgi:HEAT repeat protein